MCGWVHQLPVWWRANWQVKINFIWKILSAKNWTIPRGCISMFGRRRLLAWRNHMRPLFCTSYNTMASRALINFLNSMLLDYIIIWHFEICPSEGNIFAFGIILTTGSSWNTIGWLLIAESFGPPLMQGTPHGFWVLFESQSIPLFCPGNFFGSDCNFP